MHRPIKKYKDALKHYPSFKPLLLAQKGLNRFYYHTFPKTTHCLNYPLTVQIEPTSRCNLRCPMCVRENFDQGNMALEDFRKIIDKLKGTIKIHLQGNGEPFLHPDIFKMIQYCVSKNMLVSVITNGTLFDSHRIAHIVKSNLYEVCISVDGADKKSFEEIRIGANFDKVKQGIKNLSVALKENKKHTKLFFFVVVFRSNLHMIPDFIRLADEVSVNRVFFQQIQTKDDFMMYYTESFKEANEFVSYEEATRAIQGAIPLAEKLGVRIIYNEKSSMCLWPWWGAYITWKGEVTPCCMVFDTSSFPLGNIFETSFKEIWNNKNYQKLRKSILKRKSIPLCSGCRFF